jgi:hypothetical protein
MFFLYFFAINSEIDILSSRFIDSSWSGDNFDFDTWSEAVEVEDSYAYWGN